LTPYGGEIVARQKYHGPKDHRRRHGDGNILFTGHGHTGRVGMETMRNAIIASSLCLILAGGTAYVGLGGARGRLPESSAALKVVPDAPRVQTARLFSVPPQPREPDAIAVKLATHPVAPQMTPGRWPDVPRPSQAVPDAPKAKGAVKAEKPKAKQVAKRATPTAKPKAT
jgi:hypothetical protein